MPEFTEWNQPKPQRPAEGSRWRMLIDDTIWIVMPLKDVAERGTILVGYVVPLRAEDPDDPRHKTTEDGRRWHDPALEVFNVNQLYDPGAFLPA